MVVVLLLVLPTSANMIAMIVCECQCIICWRLPLWNGFVFQSVVEDVFLVFDRYWMQYVIFVSALGWSSWLWRGLNTAEVEGSIPFPSILSFVFCHLQNSCACLIHVECSMLYLYSWGGLVGYDAALTRLRSRVQFPFLVFFLFSFFLLPLTKQLCKVKYIYIYIYLSCYCYSEVPLYALLSKEDHICLPRNHNWWYFYCKLCDR